ncbi:MAG: DUF2809 domain-containing protein [candidate division KSB1 bacterium]|nr:DUF2809 domain-containing protein [candidate division KSB1 bacterium]
MRLKKKCAYYAAAAVWLAAAFASKYYSGYGDNFAEAYLGDFFIVGVLYFVLSAAALKLTPRRRLVAVALFALAVEAFQATGLPRSWNLPRPLSFVFGTQFDVYDTAFYIAGLCFSRIIERLLIEKANGEIL